MLFEEAAFDFDSTYFLAALHLFLRARYLGAKWLTTVAVMLSLRYVASRILCGLIRAEAADAISPGGYMYLRPVIRQ